MEVYRNGAVCARWRALGHVLQSPAKRLAHEFVDEYERRTGQTRGALAYLAECASEHGALGGPFRRVQLEGRAGREIR